jgi:DNA-binding CsgD family transcriptional regulator
VVHVLPVRPGSRHRFADLLLDTRAIVLVRPSAPGRPPDPTVLRDLLDLTLGEARLAALVGTGLTPRQAASELAISEETARTVLKRVFAKTGVSRQSELAGLMARLTLR